MRTIEVIETKENNFTLCVDKVYLHSKYYPLKEAERFIDENKELYIGKKNILVYGLGLGYHLIKLLEKVSAQCKIYVFDIDNEIVNRCNDIGLLKELKKDKRIELILEYDKKFLERLYEKMMLVDDIIMYKPSLRVLPDSFEEIKNIFKSYELGKIGVKRFGQVAGENYKHNIKIKNSIKDFFNMYNFNDKPIVIVAAGPSLENSLKVLKNFRDKFHVFALGQTLKILINNMIEPDSITIIDPQDIVYEQQFKEYENLDIPLCFLSTASRLAVESYKGPKFIFFNSEDKNNEEDIIINTGKTVAVAALDIAVKSGANEIIFIGQDLAFLNNKFYAEDEVENKSYNSSITKVVGINEQMLNTTSGMLEFKRNIEKIIKSNPQITFINCSKGAKIEGTLEMDLDKYCNIKNLD